jgi:hypothetical protein
MNRANESTAGDGGVQGVNTTNQTCEAVPAPPSICNMAALTASNLLQATQVQSCHVGSDPVVIVVPVAPMLPAASEVQP